MARVETTTPVHEIERALFAIFRGSQGTKLHRQASRAAGVELDRAGFEAYAARRGAATATAEPPARERLRRRVRGLLGADRAAAITSPDWLAARGGS